MSHDGPKLVQILFCYTVMKFIYADVKFGCLKIESGVKCENKQPNFKTKCTC